MLPTNYYYIRASRETLHARRIFIPNLFDIRLGNRDYDASAAPANKMEQHHRTALEAAGILCRLLMTCEPVVLSHRSADQWWPQQHPDLGAALVEAKALHLGPHHCNVYQIEWPGRGITLDQQEVFNLWAYLYGLTPGQYELV